MLMLNNNGHEGMKAAFARRGCCAGLDCAQGHGRWRVSVMRATLTYKALKLTIVQRQPAVGLIGTQTAAPVRLVRHLLSKHFLSAACTARVTTESVNAVMECVCQKDYANHAEAMDTIAG